MKKKLRKYSMQSVSKIADLAAKEIETFLSKLPETISVQNVENDKKYRKIDVDLIWKYKKANKILTKLIEIKADRYYHTGNYFFETISNESKNTLGCFLYTEANYIFYYFINEKELHIMQMPETKEWFLKHIKQFPEKKTSTPVGDNHYITIGRLIPRKLLIKKVKIIKIK